jgi:AcrR family transcriptional regulator
MDLFAAHGFDRTTVAEIAQRAGLTERTFFRHFADKREVLFGSSAEVGELLVDEVARVPASRPPLEAAATGLIAIGSVLQERRGREFARRRQRILDQTPELQERDLIKMAAWATALAHALSARGVGEPEAALTAEVAVAAFRVAFDQWVKSEDDRALPDLIRASIQSLRELASS